MFVNGYTGTITQNIPLTISGNYSQSSGTVTLTQANTIGSTSLSGGTLNINNASAIGTGALNLSGGTINNTSGAAITLPNNVQNWSGSFTFTGTSSLNLGTGAVTLSANSTVTITNSTATLTEGGIIGGGFSLAEGGSGTLILSGNNTFTGGLSLNGEPWISIMQGALGTGTFAIANGVTIDNTSGAAITDSNNNAQTWNGSFTFTGSSSLNFWYGCRDHDRIFDSDSHGQYFDRRRGDLRKRLFTS